MTRRRKKTTTEDAPQTVAEAIEEVERARHRARLLMALVDVLDEYAGREPVRKVLVDAPVRARLDVIAELKGELLVEASLAKQKYEKRLGAAVAGKETIPRRRRRLAPGGKSNTHRSTR